MSKISFVLTLDYELMGNGEGDIYELMIKPTYKFLELCENLNIKSTIFFEFVEYLKIKEAYNNGILTNYKSDPSKEIEKQIVKAAILGHDIQLHIHPQWINASYKNDKWYVDDKYHRLPEFLKSQDKNASDIIKEGKQTLENLICPNFSDYKCKIFRAGGLNIYPSDEILKLLRKNNFKMDSSVFHGGYAKSHYTYYNYRDIKPENLYWISNSNDITQIDENVAYNENSIIETPIFGLEERRIYKYTIFRILNKLFNPNAINTAINQMHDKIGEENLFKKLKFFLEYESVTWDFCLFNFSKHMKYYNKAKRIINQLNYNINPIILIGHSKELNKFNLKNIKKFITKTIKEGHNYTTLSTLSNLIIQSYNHKS